MANYTQDNYPFKIGEAWGWTGQKYTEWQFVITKIEDHRVYTKYKYKSSTKEYGSHNVSIDDWLGMINDPRNHGGSLDAGEWAHKPQFDDESLKPPPIILPTGSRLSLINE